MAGLGINVRMAPGAWVRRRELINRMRGHWRPALVVGVLSPAGYILVLYALRHGAPVSLDAPLRETSLMLATLAGYFIFKERISPARWLGCTVIMWGVAALAGHCSSPFVSADGITPPGYNW